MGAQTAQDPSMEDILASIRKIIAEDEQFEIQDISDGLTSQANNAAPQAIDDAQHTADLAPQVTIDGANNGELNFADKLLQVQSVQSSEQAQSAEQNHTTNESPDSIAPTRVLERQRKNLDAVFQADAETSQASASLMSAPNTAERPVFSTDRTSNATMRNIQETKPTTPVFSHISEHAPEKAKVPEKNESTPVLAEQPLMTQPEDGNLHPAIKNAMAYRDKMDTPVLSGSQSPLNMPLAGTMVEKPVFETTPIQGATAAALNIEPLISPPDDSERRVEERRIHPLRREADLDEEFSTALISVETDETVSNAFEQLKNSTTQNLDGDVQAMLRPMLREWLDSNLPSMVERLVRDEIERVSRGE